jgi:hypothetical protein
MTTDEYVAATHLALVESPIVVRYEIVRQRVTSQSGYLRVRIDLSNGDFLEAAEFFRLTPDGIQVADYRHQWMDSSRTRLHRRWDNAPHHPELENAPHHCHTDESTVVSGQPLSIQDVLLVIAREMQQDLPGTSLAS